MKIAGIIFVTICLSSISVSAQKGSASLSLGPSIGLPLNFNEGYKTGFGGGVRFYQGVSNQGSVLANVNFISFASKFSGGSAAKLTSIKIGYKTFFNSDRFFIYGDGGLVLKSGGTGNTGSDPGLGVGLGYSIPAGKNGHIDVVPSFNIVFQSVINRAWVDAHIAYRFDLSKK